jgi:predicted DNA-binding transcriptional regulator AlpA
MDTATETSSKTLITPRQLRERLAISRTTEWRLVRDGVLSPIMLPTGGRRYPSGEVPALIARLCAARADAMTAAAA